MSHPIRGCHIHLVGAKGTGMTALAEILQVSGAILTGSDVPDTFYTDRILQALGVSLFEGFAPDHIGPAVQLVIHSAAYSRESNPELLEAARRAIPILTYPEALGAMSRRYDSSGIAGVHGKTTTTALCGSLAGELGLPATILAGSAVSSFDGRCTRILGDRYFIAETCEYRRHFLHFSPRRIILTSVEPDHQDYYPTYADIRTAFIEYGRILACGGELIYCADDPGAVEVAEVLRSERPDLVLTPYGECAEGPYRLLSYQTDGEGQANFSLAGFSGPFSLRLPGRHLALDATAAIALTSSLLHNLRGNQPWGEGCTPEEADAMRRALAAFQGSKRRSEVLGEAQGVLFLDDYGHHPTAIKATITGIRAFWPKRRLVVDFMSHTYSRTKALFGDFAASLDEADELVLHKIYASARETPDPSVTGKALADAAAARENSRHGDRVAYFEDPLDAMPYLEKRLQAGDIFLTMGAGDNWRLGLALLERLRQRE